MNPQTLSPQIHRQFKTVGQPLRQGAARLTVQLDSNLKARVLFTAKSSQHPNQQFIGTGENLLDASHREN